MWEPELNVGSLISLRVYTGGPKDKKNTWQCGFYVYGLIHLLVGNAHRYYYLRL